jgi:predicted enzyme related to lactoylglutathione lyase
LTRLGEPVIPVSTSELDAGLARATKKGAKVMNGPMDVPGGGWIAQLTDPQGAVFALHQAPTPY